MNKYKTLFIVALVAIFASCSDNDDEKDSDNSTVELTVDYESHAIDLGLSVRWANMNVGAETEDDLGNYFAWGETEPKDTFKLSTYQYYDNDYIYIGNNIETTTYDAARANWGGKWRMPTKNELKELVEQCDWKWEWGTTFNTFGYRVVGPNGNSIYLPAAGGYTKDSDPSNLWNKNDFGYYWMSTLETKGLASLLRFNKNKPTIEINDVYKGMSVRAVVE